MIRNLWCFKKGLKVAVLLYLFASRVNIRAAESNLPNIIRFCGFLTSNMGGESYLPCAIGRLHWVQYCTSNQTLDSNCKTSILQHVIYEINVEFSGLQDLRIYFQVCVGSEKCVRRTVTMFV